MIKRFFLTFFFCTYGSSVWSVPTYNIVYRTDDRPLTQIQEAGGMWPWRQGTPDDDLSHHFEGESVENHSSNFVSTTANLRVVVEHAASLARPNSDEPFDENFVTYIYVIRPNEDFYNVDASLIFARDEAVQDSIRRERLDRLIRDYTGMEEVVAYTGFSAYRIIFCAELTGEMLRQHGVEQNSVLFSEAFWESRWINNDMYDPIFDTDTSNYEVYSFVDTPRGYVAMVVNGTQPPVSLGATCLGVSPDISSFSLNMTKDELACSKNQYLNITTVFYDKEFLNILLYILF